MGIKTATDKKKFSQLRQSLDRLANEIRQIVEPFFSDKPVIKGSVYELKTKCGKPGCKCAKGQLHHRRCYQELRRVRVRLIEVHKKIVQIMDEMEAMRREELPSPDKKRPPREG